MTGITSGIQIKSNIYQAPFFVLASRIPENVIWTRLIVSYTADAGGWGVSDSTSASLCFVLEEWLVSLTELFWLISNAITGSQLLSTVVFLQLLALCGMFRSYQSCWHLLGWDLGLVCDAGFVVCMCSGLFFQIWFLKFLQKMGKHPILRTALKK